MAPHFSKLNRAKRHICELKIELQKFVSQKPYRILPDLQDNDKEIVWHIEFDAIPEEIECIAADIVHNLRTPLDRALTSNFHDPKMHTQDAKLRKIGFPFAPSQSEFEKRKCDQKKHLKADVIEILSDSEPFVGGKGEALWVLNELDNRDKHRPILTPILVDFLALQNRGLRMQRGKVLRLGSSRGKHLIPAPAARLGAWHLHQPAENLRPILRLAPATLNDLYLEFSSEFGDTELFTTTSDAIICLADIEPEISVSLCDAASFTGRPVVNALEEMSKAVEKILSDFERKFSE